MVSQRTLQREARQTMWDVPTSHITAEDWRILSNWTFDCPRSIPHQHGVIIFLDSDPEVIMPNRETWRARGLSDYFLRIFEAACRDPKAPILLNFDHDAHPLSLPYPAEEMAA